jgi:hypothetical protein
MGEETFKQMEIWLAQLDRERNRLRPFEVRFERCRTRAMDCVPQPRKREEGYTPVLTDCGSVDQLTSRFEKCGDQGEGFRRKFVGRCEGILGVLRFPPDIWDPRNRIVDLR